MPQCSVPGCSNQGGHKFPADKDMKKKWIVAIRRGEDGVGGTGKLWQPTVCARVCHFHFTATDYLSFNAYGR